MAKVMINLNVKDITEVIAQLGQQDITRLIKKLEKETWSSRFKQLLRRVRQRADRYPPSEQEILREVKESRKRRYDQDGY